MGKGSTRGPRDPWEPHSDPRRVHRELYTIFPLLTHRLLAVLLWVLDPIVVGALPTCRHMQPAYRAGSYAQYKCCTRDAHSCDYTLSELTDQDGCYEFSFTMRKRIPFVIPAYGNGGRRSVLLHHLAILIWDLLVPQRRTG